MSQKIEKLDDVNFMLEPMGAVRQQQLKKHNVVGLSMRQVQQLGQLLIDNMGQINNTCLRNGILLDINYSIDCGMDYSWAAGRVQLLGLCDVVHCKCDETFNFDASGVRKREKMCFERLATGHCKDNFVRNTVGCVLFPGVYGKQK